MRKRILFVCGSMNQTTQMHQIARELPEYEHFFSPYYGDRVLSLACRLKLTEFTVMGEKLTRRCLDYLSAQNLNADHYGKHHQYKLVVTCSDLVIPRNIRHSQIILVQEGMTDPETFAYHLVRRVRSLPRWLASTAATGLSDAYDRFCVASPGYRDHFIRKGVNPAKLVVTGIPNFDNCARYLDNDFPHRGFVLVCTSDARETFKHDDRRAFIRRAVEIAAGRQLVFKLHPNEKIERATREIKAQAPAALIFAGGSAEAMIANCGVLITQYSSTAFVGLALGKQVHSYFDIDELRRLLPVQNASAAKNIAEVCHQTLIEPLTLKSRTARGWLHRAAQASEPHCKVVSR
jgi:hypothetical protein